MFQRGYIAVYEGNDFLELEKFPNKIQNMPDKVAYIWEVVTRKEFMGRGIAKKLLSYVLDKFENYTIYSCVDPENIPSLKLHEKNGFKELYRFLKKEDKKTSEHMILVRIPMLEI